MTDLHFFVIYYNMNDSINSILQFLSPSLDEIVPICKQWGTFNVIFYSILIFAVPYLVTSLFYCYLDLCTNYITKRYAEKDKHKLRKIYLKVLPLALFNLFITHFIVVYIAIRWIKIELNSFSLEEFLYKLFLIKLIQEFCFYFLHRLFHCAFLYNLFHYIQHESKAIITLSGVYIHPLEYIILIFGPELLALHLTGPHNIYAMILTTVTSGLAISHSHSSYVNKGYAKHYLYKNRYYSINGIADFIFNTGSTSSKVKILF
jgi:sterol desaturase/sphingolipid hydroxylase (fatty acid hydroxylase superfamily)